MKTFGFMVDQLNEYLLTNRLLGGFVSPVRISKKKKQKNKKTKNKKQKTKNHNLSMIKIICHELNQTIRLKDIEKSHFNG